VHAEEDGKGEEFGAFAHAHAGEEDDFDGTPGGLDSFGAESESEAFAAEMAGFSREALPSPGLSRGGGGFGFGANEGARGMGGF
jgi:hypothetical protein